jgi:hypothetical protein
VDREDNRGITLQFGRHGCHGVETTGRGSQIGADRIEPHFPVQNPRQDKGTGQERVVPATGSKMSLIAASVEGRKRPPI